MALTQVKTNAIEDDAVTLAKQAGGTDGQIITYDASGNPTAVGPGTDGQVLTSTGAGSPPAFEDVPAGGIASLVADTSPQLGGDLDTNDFEIKLDDSHNIKFGDGDGSNGADLKIRHDGTNNHIEGLNGSTYIGAVANVEIRNTDSAGSNAEWMGRFIADGAVELYYDNSKKFETVAGGAKVNSSSAATAEFGIQAASGQNAELWLLSDAGNQYGDKVRLLQDDGVLSTQFNTASNTWENSIKCTANGNVELYYDNSKKVETTSTGLKLESSAGGWSPLIELSNTNAGAWAGEIRFNSYYNSTAYEVAAIHATGGSSENDGALQLSTRNVHRLTINKDGYVNTPNQPAFHYYSPTNSSTNARMTGNNEDLVFGTSATNVGSHYSTTNGRFTAPIAGRYLFMFNGLIDNDAGSAHRNCNLYKNGSWAGVSLCYGFQSGDGNYHALSGSGILVLAANDYVTFRATEGWHCSTETNGGGYLLG